MDYFQPFYSHKTAPSVRALVLTVVFLLVPISAHAGRYKLVQGEK